MVHDMAKTNTEVVKVLEICRDIELASAELYRYFSEIFSDHEAMAALWHKTAMEEDSHAMQFIMAIKMRKEAMIDTLAIDVSRAENTLKIVKSLNTVVRKNKPSMLDALQAAIKMEKGLVGFHMATVAHFVHESHKKLFSAMMKADNEHIEALENFYQKLSAAR